ncbi:MAG: histidine kinase [Pyrinomonadaceae bacterium]|nr:histidine kinase [Pyrinomonadaceae bacterium]
MIQKFKNSFWLFQIGGWLIYFVMIYITFLTIAAEGNFLRLFYLKLFRAFIGFLLTSVLREFYRRIFDKYSLNFVIATVFICAVIFGCIWTAFENLYTFQTAASYNFADSLARAPRVVLDFAMTLTAWSAIYFGFKYWQKAQSERENALASSALAQKAQLEMLRYQMNPHFLFNALNSIRASIDEDGKRAEQMITSLSEFLRYSLLHESSKTIELREEIEAVKNYLAIEKIRFEEKLEVDFTIEKAAEDFKVPCFLLNPLVENAVKHGLQTSAKPLKINLSAKISENKLILEISNSGKLQDVSNGNGTKIGLKNVRERLEKLFGGGAKFGLKEESGFVKAKVEISSEI